VFGVLIFDKFPSREKAEEFARLVTRERALEVKVFDSQKESDKSDPFPCQLTPPIVQVERPNTGSPDTDLGIERSVEERAACFGGSFMVT
jgi:hypothetical protein